MRSIGWPIAWSAEETFTQRHYVPELRLRMVLEDRRYADAHRTLWRKYAAFFMKFAKWAATGKHIIGLEHSNRFMLRSVAADIDRIKAAADRYFYGGLLKQQQDRPPAPPTDAENVLAYVHNPPAGVQKVFA